MYFTDRDHAIVVGASIAGLTTAAVLATRFSHVTVIERASPPTAGSSIAPHGRYPHSLLDGGSRALNRIFPGFTEELLAAGGVPVARDQVAWWAGDWRVARASSPPPRALCSRALVEAAIRRRVQALDNVAVVYRSPIDGLLVHADRVVGVRTRDGEIRGNLVVDCSGRTSRAIEWLAEHAIPAPPITEIQIDMAYQSFMLPRRPADLGGTCVLVVQNMAPHSTRMALALAQENDTWHIVLGGYFGDMAPSDRDGFLAYARSLPVPDVADLLASRDAIGEPLGYVYRANRRVHFERAPLPAGFLVLGDALCSFNPIFGQGMTVAVMQAEHLGSALGEARVQRDLAEIANRAWLLTASAELAYPQIAGKRSPIAPLMRRYMHHVFRAACRDPHVVDALLDVTNLIAPMSSLLAPRMMARVMRASRVTSDRTTRSSIHHQWA